MGKGPIWWVALVIFLLGSAALPVPTASGKTNRILLDTDVDTDDIFALIYLLKQNRAEIDLKAVTINANAWTDAGHAVNQVYDVLYMMGRDDIPVGVGGDGGISPDGTIFPNVGGYLPLIDQGMSTVGDCRYRQAIPSGSGGRLDIDANYGLRKGLLPQGNRKYTPLLQPTAQQVMFNTISAGPTVVFLIGSHTNFAVFLMSNPQLKRNVEHIFVMGGGVRAKNPTGCCPKDATLPCKPKQCGDSGNLFTGYTTNPYAEFNIFGDPFAAYQVIHSGIPITLVPLDATNTIPITANFFSAFAKRQNTYEAQYCFQSLKMAHDTWFDDTFFTSYFMWDSFTAGVAVSIMRNNYQRKGENNFALMQYLNITVVTSNKPYGTSDGSNPLFDGRVTPKFRLQKGGVHSGHIQTGIRDPFCLVNNGTDRGKCQDGYTMETKGPESVQVLVAQRAKPNQNFSSSLDRAFFVSFLDALNLPQQSGRFNLSTQFPFYREILYKPNLSNRKLGKPFIFDMDMSAGDFLALFYLLKVPTDKIDLKGILVNANGWANAATIDIIYDILHMMGRDDIPVGLGSVTPIGTPFYSCKYVRAIPRGSGGFLDSDTLFGLARNLPRSPRRYTAENSVKYGAPRNTSHPELRQPLVLEVWQSISAAVRSKGQKITVLTNGPLTNLANIILADKNAISTIQNVYIVGGHISEDGKQMGNVFTVPSNKYSEFNFYFDPLAAKTVIESKLNITLIPLSLQRSMSSFPLILQKLQLAFGTPESRFSLNLLSTMFHLQLQSANYKHMDTFLGEILGAIVLTNDPIPKAATVVKPISVLTGDMTNDGQIVVKQNGGKLVNVLTNLSADVYYSQFTSLLSNISQSAVIGSFDDQARMWRTPK